MTSRREFLKGAAALAAAPMIIPAGVLAAPGRPGANDKIAIADEPQRIADVGCVWRGREGRRRAGAVTPLHALGARFVRASDRNGAAWARCAREPR